MDKLKKILSPGHEKDDEAMYGTGSQAETTGAKGKVTGQGSHFGATPETATSSTAQDYSTTAPATSTADSSYKPTATEGSYDNPSSATETGALGTSGTQSSYPTTDREAEGTGRAAVGETSTYSSRPLGQGDQTSSVVDPNSSDPTTYRKSETSSSGLGSAGVGSGAALTAAAAAFKKDKSQESSSDMPGSFPASNSNPYANPNIDSRVDSLEHRSNPETTGTTSSNTGRDAALGTAGYEAVKPHGSSTEPTGTNAPSDLGSTAPPALRSTMRDEPGTAGTPRAPAATSTGETEHHKASIKDKVFGALGIGAAGAAAKERKASHGETAVDSAGTSHGPPSHHRKESIPTTAYPSGSFDAPRAVNAPVGGTQPRHGSVAEINQQTRRDSQRMQAAGAYSGGYAAYDGRDHTQERLASQVPAKEHGSHLGRDAAIGAGALGATGLGAHEYEKRHEPATSGTAGVTSSTGVDRDQTRPDKYEPGHQGIGSTVHDMTTSPTPDKASYAVDDRSRGEGSHFGPGAGVAGAGLGAGAGAGALAGHEYGKREDGGTTTVAAPATTSSTAGGYPTTGSSTTEPIRQQDDHHYGRDAGLAGAGVGAGALAAHEYGKREDGGMTTAAAPATTSSTAGGYPTTGSSTTEPIRQQDDHHYGRDAGLAGAGVGAGALAGHEYGKREDGGTTTATAPATTSSTAGGYPTTGSSTAEPIRQQDDHHYGRDAGLAGAGVGAGALAAHEYSSRDRDANPTTTTGVSSGGTPATSGYAPTTSDSATYPTREKDESHLGRDAAIGGGAAGVGAGALGEHEHSKHEAEKAEKQREHEQKKYAKEQEKAEKAHEKEVRKEEKHHEKELKAEHKQEQKDRDAEISALQEQRKREYEERKAEVARDQHQRIQQRIAEEEEKKRHGHEGIAAGGVGAAALGAGAYEAEKHHEGKENEPLRSEAAPGTAVGSGPGAREYQDQSTTGSSHRGAETAAGVGAGGLAAHELGKRDETTGQGASTSNQPWNTTGESTSSTTGAGPGTGDRLDPAQYFEKPAATDLEAADRGHDVGGTAGAAGTAAAVGGGAAAYQAEKEHGQDVPKDHHLADERTDKDASSGIGAGTGSSGDGHNKLHKEPKPKKQGFFRRIFKRRKNKDTGESEDYSSEEEDHTHGHEATALGTAGTAAGATAAHEHHSHDQRAMGQTGTAHDTDSAGYNVTGHGQAEREIQDPVRSSGKGLAMGEPGTAAATDSSGYALGTDQQTFNKPSYSPFTSTKKVQDQVQHGTVIGGQGGSAERDVDTKTGAPVNE